MERLTVYEDYIHHMSFLRASRNRVLNAMDTSNITEPEKDIIAKACLKICSMHSRVGLALVAELTKACTERKKPEIQKTMQRLHKFNRQTARLSRLFEEDVSDSHPDPDAPIDDTKPKPVYDASKCISVNIFLNKLNTLSSQISQV